jgi:hypothetical protein
VFEVKEWEQCKYAVRRIGILNAEEVDEWFDQSLQGRELEEV